MRESSIFQKIDAYTFPRLYKEMGLYPYFREIASEQGPEVVLRDGRRLLMLGSNSYLGLTRHPEVMAAAAQALNRYGTSCAGSRFLNGTLDLHIELEEELARWVGKEASIVFTTGFQVNQGVISVLAGRHDWVILDSHDHASIVDGARQSMAKVVKYRHNDMGHLEEILAGVPADKGKLIVVDGVFSMEGDIARLPHLVELSDAFRAVVMVDDAHGLGVLGKEGSGTLSHFGLTDRVDFIMGTFSKSLASIGGFIAADRPSVEFLKHHARSLMFSASLPPPCAAAALAALRLIRKEPELRQRLWSNTTRMKEGLVAEGFDTGFSETPIIPVRVGEIFVLAVMCKRLEEEGIFVNPVVPPAVPPHDCLLRISLTAAHSHSQIDQALEIFRKVGKSLNIV